MVLADNRKETKTVCHNRINLIRLWHNFDMIMIKITEKQQKVLLVLIQNGSLRSSEIRNEILRFGENGYSLVTVKRELSKMTALGLLIAEGAGRSRTYRINNLGRMFTNVDAHSYCSVEPDQRRGLESFNFQLFPELLTDIFSTDELRTLDNATDEYKRRTANVSAAIQQKELERLIIELSWKSSKIEGNTYTLLDTEKLILEHKEAVGHDKKEATMILNHKDAFIFVQKHVKDFKTLTSVNLEQLHKLLVKDMSVGGGFRQSPVGVTGSKYYPLDNIYQIKEAIVSLSEAILRIKTPYAKALIALLGISYIQPFEDGNKRTARLMANALLLAHGYAPLSYRSVDENEYREGMLVFYELNSIVPFKYIFIGQYEFAAKSYVINIK